MTADSGLRCLRPLLVLLGVIIGCVFAPQADAELFVYEPFDYPAGEQLIGKNGGMGFTGAWRDETVANSATIQSGSINYPGLAVSGNSVLMTGVTNTLQIYRDFVNIEGADGTTTWISFLGQRLGPIQDPATNPDNPYPRGVNISFYNTEDDDPATTERFAVGNSTNAPTNNWAFIGRGSVANILPALNPPAPYGGAPPAFVVIRIDHHGDPNINGGTNNDDVYFFVNPDPALEPATASANAQRLSTDPNAFDYSGLDYFRPFIGNTSSGRPYGELLWDELRIGTTYADVSAGGAPLLPGDTDGDGVPGEFPDDFEPIRAHFRKYVAMRSDGDLVSNGYVDFADFREWKTAFLSGGGSLADIDLSFAAGVPEPATWLLAAVACGALAKRKRGRDSFSRLTVKNCSKR